MRDYTYEQHLSYHAHNLRDGNCKACGREMLGNDYSDWICLRCENTATGYDHEHGNLAEHVHPHEIPMGGGV